MTIDMVRVNTLMDEVKMVAMEIPKVYRGNGPILDTEQRALQLLRRAAAILAEILVVAPVGSPTYAMAVDLHRKTVTQLIDTARTCIHLEAALMAEVKGQTLH